MFTQKPSVLLLAGGLVAWRTMEPITRALAALGVGFKVLFYGQDAPKLAAQVNILMLNHVLTVENIGVLDIRNFRAVVITDNPLNLAADIRSAIFSSGIKRYGVHHGPLPGEYSKTVFSISDVYFGLYEEEAIYLRAGNEASSKVEFVSAGTPKTDHLLKMESARQSPGKIAFPRHAGVANEKIVVITSHWGPLGLMRMYGRTLIDAVAGFGEGVRFVFSAHPKLSDETPKGPDFNRPEIQALLQEIPMAGHTYYQGDTTDLLPCADIVIGDMSAIMSEASIFDVDIICDRRVPISIENLDKKFRSMVYEFCNAGQLREAISYVIEHPREKNQERVSFAKTLFPHLGKSATLIAARIYRDLTLGV